MPSRRLRKHLLDRVLSGVRGVGERGLALLMTAGVASCSAGTASVSDGGTKDQSADQGPTGIEAMQVEGGVVEAANLEGGVVEAAQTEGGTPDAGRDAADACPDTGVFVEAAQFDSGPC
jgi:hypothetical protein